MNVKTILAAASLILSAILAPGAAAQDKSGVAVAQTEAVVKVIKIDRKARKVTIQGPTGGTMVLNIPPEAQNLDRVKVGSLFKANYVESVAVSLQKGGGVASASETQTVHLAPKGGTPGGMVVNTRQVSATVEQLNLATRQIAVKGPKGHVFAFTVADGVEGLDQFHVGDLITVTYSEALVLGMLPADKKSSGAKK
jgi:Cu/Ag efflux protein CusF